MSKESPYTPFEAVSAKNVLENGATNLVPFTYTTTAKLDSRGKASDITLSSLSLAAAEATAQLTLEGVGDFIDIAGENTWGIPGKSTPEMMREIIDAQLSGLERVRLISTAATYTVPQIISLRSFYEANPTEEVPISITMDFHQDRVLRLARGLGLPMVGITVQDILQEAGRMADYPELNHLQAFDRRERLARLITRLDDKGTVLSLLAKISGAQLHDVRQDGDRFTPIVSTVRAARKVAREI